MIKLEGTTACLMRDELEKARFDKKITTGQITNKLSKMELPDWLISQTLQMEQYRKFDRCTCPIEQAMAQAVYNKIVKDLMDKEK